MTNHRIRTTFTPGEPITVGDAELLDLTRQGLVLDAEKSAKLDAAEAEAAEQAKTDTDDEAPASPTAKKKGA